MDSTRKTHELPKNHVTFDGSDNVAKNHDNFLTNNLEKAQQAVDAVASVKVISSASDTIKELNSRINYLEKINDTKYDDLVKKIETGEAKHEKGEQREIYKMFESINFDGTHCDLTFCVEGSDKIFFGIPPDGLRSRTELISSLKQIVQKFEGYEKISGDSAKAVVEQKYTELFQNDKSFFKNESNQKRFKDEMKFIDVKIICTHDDKTKIEGQCNNLESLLKSEYNPLSKEQTTYNEKFHKYAFVNSIVNKPDKDESELVPGISSYGEESTSATNFSNLSPLYNQANSLKSKLQGRLDDKDARNSIAKNQGSLSDVQEKYKSEDMLLEKNFQSLKLLKEQTDKLLKEMKTSGELFSNKLEDLLEERKSLWNTIELKQRTKKAPFTTKEVDIIRLNKITNEAMGRLNLVEKEIQTTIEKQLQDQAPQHDKRKEKVQSENVKSGMSKSSYGKESLSATNFNSLSSLYNANSLQSKLQDKFNTEQYKRNSIVKKQGSLSDVQEKYKSEDMLLEKKLQSLKLLKEHTNQLLKKMRTSREPFSNKLKNLLKDEQFLWNTIDSKQRIKKAPFVTEEVDILRLNKIINEAMERLNLVEKEIHTTIEKQLENQELQHDKYRKEEVKSSMSKLPQLTVFMFSPRRNELKQGAYGQ